MFCFDLFFFNFDFILFYVLVWFCVLLSCDLMFCCPLLSFALIWFVVLISCSLWVLLKFTPRSPVVLRGMATASCGPPGPSYRLISLSSSLVSLFEFSDNFRLRLPWRPCSPFACFPLFLGCFCLRFLWLNCEFSLKVFLVFPASGSSCDTMTEGGADVSTHSCRYRFYPKMQTLASSRNTEFVPFGKQQITAATKKDK